MSHVRRIQAVSVFTAKGARPSLEDFVSVNRDKGIFAVADGFGGPAAGAAAAKAACEGVREFLEREAGDLEATLPFEIRSYFSLAGNVLFNAIIHANRKVRALNKGKNVHEMGGASTLAAFVDGDLLAMANVGACSAWILRDGREARLVVPRTYGRLCDPIEEEVPFGDAPLMALGMSDDLQPEIVEYRIRSGDWVILNTDGLTPALRQEVWNIQALGLSAPEAAQKVKEALQGFQAGTKDNLSISLVIF